MSEKSQFSLLTERRYLPFFIAQLAGAFNDNLFKQALALAITYKLLTFDNVIDQSFITFLFGESGIDKSLLANLCAIVFILPFFLFSALGGQLGEKYEKASLIKNIKLAEIFTMILGAAGLLLNSFALMLFVLFAMGIQSSLFGPVKYSILPQHLKEKELIGGNALVEMGTFFAILMGTILAGVLISNRFYAYSISFLTLAVAIVGYVSSREILHSPAPLPQLKLSFNIFAQTWTTMRLGFTQTPAVSRSILGNSWFWFLGIIYITQIPNYAEVILNGDASATTLILIVFSISIAIGSGLCEKLSGHKVEIGLVPFGSIGLTVFTILLWWHSQTLPMIDGHSNSWLTLLNQSTTWLILFDFFGIGLFGGFYIVPLYAIIQSRSTPNERARVIAANNILNALFMVLAAFLAILLLSFMSLTIPQLFLVAGVMNIFVNLYIFSVVPEFALRFLMWLLSHSIYKVSHQGLDHIPDEGGYVLVSNHVSYVDALLIGGAVKRPIRFVMYYKIFNIPILRFIFRLANTIPIAGQKEDKAIFEKAFIDIAEALQKGELVCIFPEGMLTTNGEINQFKAGIEKIVNETPVPVIPIAIQGLWKTSFTRNPKRKLLRNFRSPIQIIADKPIEATQINKELLHNKVVALRGDKA